MSSLNVRLAVAYMPAPKKAPWPKEKYPEKPERIAHEVASATQKNTR